MKPYHPDDLPSIEYLREHFNYDPMTGDLVFKKSARRGWAGKKATYKTTKGYLLVKLPTVNMHVHRIAWAWMTGEWPPQDKLVDHKNRDRSDNRWANLRLATYAQNEANSVLARTGGIKGVRFYRGGWRARITHQYKEYYLGTFGSAEEASEAYRLAAIKFFGAEWAGTNNP